MPSLSHPLQVDAEGVELEELGDAVLSGVTHAQTNSMMHPAMPAQRKDNSKQWFHSEPEASLTHAQLTAAIASRYGVPHERATHVEPLHRTQSNEQSLAKIKEGAETGQQAEEAVQAGQQLSSAWDRTSLQETALLRHPTFAHSAVNPMTFKPKKGVWAGKVVDAGQGLSPTWSGAAAPQSMSPQTAPDNLNAIGNRAQARRRVESRESMEPMQPSPAWDWDQGAQREVIHVQSTPRRPPGKGRNAFVTSQRLHPVWDGGKDVHSMGTNSTTRAQPSVGPTNGDDEMWEGRLGAGWGGGSIHSADNTLRLGDGGGSGSGQLGSGTDASGTPRAGAREGWGGSNIHSASTTQRLSDGGGGSGRLESVTEGAVTAGPGNGWGGSDIHDGDGELRLDAASGVSGRLEPSTAGGFAPGPRKGWGGMTGMDMKGGQDGAVGDAASNVEQHGGEPRRLGMGWDGDNSTSSPAPQSSNNKRLSRAGGARKAKSRMFGLGWQAAPVAGGDSRTPAHLSDSSYQNSPLLPRPPSFSRQGGGSGWGGDLGRDRLCDSTDNSSSQVALGGGIADKRRKGGDGWGGGFEGRRETRQKGRRVTRVLTKAERQASILARSRPSPRAAQHWHTDSFSPRSRDGQILRLDHSSEDEGIQVIAPSTMLGLGWDTEMQQRMAGLSPKEKSEDQLRIFLDEPPFLRKPPRQWLCDELQIRPDDPPFVRALLATHDRPVPNVSEGGLQTPINASPSLRVLHDTHPIKAGVDMELRILLDEAASARQPRDSGLDDGLLIRPYRLPVSRVPPCSRRSYSKLYGELRTPLDDLSFAPLLTPNSIPPRPNSGGAEEELRILLDLPPFGRMTSSNRRSVCGAPQELQDRPDVTPAVRHSYCGVPQELRILADPIPAAIPNARLHRSPPTSKPGTHSERKDGVEPNAALQPQAELRFLYGGTTEKGGVAETELSPPQPEASVRTIKRLGTAVLHMHGAPRAAVVVKRQPGHEVQRWFAEEAVPVGEPR